MTKLCNKIEKEERFIATGGVVENQVSQVFVNLTYFDADGGAEFKLCFYTVGIL